MWKSSRLVGLFLFQGSSARQQSGGILCLFNGCSSDSKLKVVDALSGAAAEKQEVWVQGWVRAVRAQKEITFLDLNDGSSLQSLQIVARPDLDIRGITYGSAIEIWGKLVQSPHTKQSTELLADKIRLVGSCNPVNLPFKIKERHSLEYIRQFPHLRCKTNVFSSLLRIRSEAAAAIHSFFKNNGFVHIHTPIITSNDCEGAGELFQIEPASKTAEKHDNAHFFDVPSFLTVSGQLHLEVMTGFFTKMYICFYSSENILMPLSFEICSMAPGRAKIIMDPPPEKVGQPCFLTYVTWLPPIPCTLVFDLLIIWFLQVMENLFKTASSHILSNRPDDVELFHKYVAPGQKERLELMLKNSFQVLSYTEAIDILQRSMETFNFEPKWGCDLQTEHENYLVEHCGNIPVFVVNYPYDIKPFYARDNQDEPQHTVAAVDLLVPGIGELCGGSLREERLDLLQFRLKQRRSSSACRGPINPLHFFPLHPLSQMYHLPLSDGGATTQPCTAGKLGPGNPSIGLRGGGCYGASSPPGRSGPAIPASGSVAGRCDLPAHPPPIHGARRRDLNKILRMVLTTFCDLMSSVRRCSVIACLYFSILNFTLICSWSRKLQQQAHGKGVRCYVQTGQESVGKWRTDAEHKSPSVSSLCPQYLAVRQRGLDNVCQPRDSQGGDCRAFVLDLHVVIVDRNSAGRLEDSKCCPMVQEGEWRQPWHGHKDNYKWYEELRQFGSVPHGGFGFGFERYLQCVLGVVNIKDVIPFPRFSHSCLL
ncbi:probable asparagine--tRNA ligase, mitochondrial [Heterodontus francisci]|uniref:probable asparagine--tRNA ligase, mitochondrial n=1 Tax=Heterodontus francisci TaxID=7792 RepID=UPI00355BEE51